MGKMEMAGKDKWWEGRMDKWKEGRKEGTVFRSPFP